jgi:hypothetical protein
MCGIAIRHANSGPKILLLMKLCAEHEATFSHAGNDCAVYGVPCERVDALDAALRRAGFTIDVMVGRGSWAEDAA